MAIDNPDQAMDFPGRLQRLRRQRGWSEQELAERAGVSAKTIKNIESGKQLNPLEHTRIKLAEALDVNYDYLWFDRSEALDGLATDGDEAPAAKPASAVRWRRWVTLGAVAIVILVIGAALAVTFMRPSGDVVPELFIENDNLVARGPLTGEVVWRFDAVSNLSFFSESPWDDDTVLVGLGCGSEDGGRLYLLDRIAGGEIWRCEVDRAHVVAAFGQEHVDGAGFHCPRVSYPDLDGDGVCEVSAEFGHGKWFPHSVVFLTREGRRLGQYDHRGHVYGAVVTDLNHDGRDEVVFAGTNNDRDYQCGSVFKLDLQGMSGASVYPQAGESCSLPDSAAVRVAFASFGQAFMDCIEIPRLMAQSPMVFQTAGGETRISIDLGAGRGGVVVTLDENLRPLSVDPNDHFTIEFADCMDILTEQTDGSLQAWLDQWLTRAVRFEAGHWPGRSGGLAREEGGR